MSYIIAKFPSVLESTTTDLSRVTSSQLTGLKIKSRNRDYLVGKLALSEGKSPHKSINCSPEDTDYQVLMKSALLLSKGSSNGKKLHITTGFPFSTFQMNKKKAVDFIKEDANIIHDTRPYGGNGYEDEPIEIGNIHIIPELLGAMIAARKGESGISGGMFVVSVGFGTLEIGLSTDDGFIQRTFNSGPGIRHAVNSAMNRLQENHFLDLRTEHQFDDSFHRGTITLNRRKIDLSEVKKESLQEYYNDVIFPLIRNSWTDEDFNKAGTLLLVGGGALYSDLVNAFREEFEGILNVVVPDEPMYMASKGYLIHSIGASDGDGSSSVGIDIGNAYTCISMEDEQSTIANYEQN